MILMFSSSVFGAESVADASKIPPESLNKLQNTLARVTELLWAKNEVYFHEGYHQRCIAVLRLITELDPSDVEAYGIGAWLMDSSDKPADAEAFLKTGISNNPVGYYLYNELASHYYQLKNYESAVNYYRIAVQQQDCPSLVWHSLAHAFEKGGKIEDSIKTWKHAKVLEPDDPVVDMNLDRVKQESKATISP